MAQFQTVDLDTLGDGKARAARILRFVMLGVGAVMFVVGVCAQDMMRFEYDGEHISMHSPLGVLAGIGLFMIIAAVAMFVVMAVLEARSGAERLKKITNIVGGTIAGMIMFSAAVTMAFGCYWNSNRDYDRSRCTEYTDGGRTVVICDGVYEPFSKGEPVAEAFQIKNNKAVRLGEIGPVDAERITLEWQDDSVKITYPFFPTGEPVGESFKLR